MVVSRAVDARVDQHRAADIETVVTDDQARLAVTRCDPTCDPEQRQGDLGSVDADKLLPLFGIRIELYQNSGGSDVQHVWNVDDEGLDLDLELAGRLEGVTEGRLAGEETQGIDGQIELNQKTLQCRRDAAVLLGRAAIGVARTTTGLLTEAQRRRVCANRNRHDQLAIGEAQLGDRDAWSLDVERAERDALVRRTRILFGRRDREHVRGLDRVDRAAADGWREHRRAGLK